MIWKRGIPEWCSEWSCVLFCSRVINLGWGVDVRGSWVRVSEVCSCEVVFAILEWFLWKIFGHVQSSLWAACYGAPAWETIFKDWPNISAIRSGQYLFISWAKRFENYTYSDKGLVNDVVDMALKVTVYCQWGRQGHGCCQLCICWAGCCPSFSWWELKGICSGANCNCHFSLHNTNLSIAVCKEELRRDDDAE